MNESKDDHNLTNNPSYVLLKQNPTKNNLKLEEMNERRNEKHRLYYFGSINHKKEERRDLGFKVLKF